MCKVIAAMHPSKVNRNSGVFVSTEEQLLFELKLHGPATTADLAASAGIGHQTARERLNALRAAQLIERTRAPPAVGRPLYRWSLTEKGRGCLPDTLAQVMAELVEGIRTELGEAGLARVLAKREHGIAENYEQVLRGAQTLEDRVERLVRLRTADGYMADAYRSDDSTYVIVENHCPICSAATVCQGICRSELALFERLLAPAEVTRFDHILAGAKRCSFVVVPAA
jgi:predicted ArsR family transcriptional regulator